ncbi:MAG: hypothetical protein R2818_10980 [Flavobacteriales bacterium]
MRSLILIPSLLASFVLCGQERSGTGYLLNWTEHIKVERDSLVNGKYKLPAYAFEVFESDAKMAVDEWVSAYEEKGGKVTGSDPYKGAGVVVDGLNGEVTVMANVVRNKKDGKARVVVALAANDSTAAPDESKGEKAVHDLAIRMNKGVVQKQIDDQQELVDDLTKDLASAQKDQSKAQNKSADANDDLESAKKKKAKLSNKQSDLQHDQAKYQERYTRTNDPKDLQKLTKIQQDLVKVQRDMSKQLKKEADAQKAANKRQGDIPDAVEDQQDLQAKKEKAVSDLEALKRKKEAVK